VLAIEPTCSYMLRKEYGELLGTPEARAVAGATMDLCEYLFQLKQQGQFNREFRSTPGAHRHTTYRAICGPRISATARAI